MRGLTYLRKVIGYGINDKYLTIPLLNNVVNHLITELWTIPKF